MFYLSKQYLPENYHVHLKIIDFQMVVFIYHMLFKQVFGSMKARSSLISHFQTKKQIFKPFIKIITNIEVTHISEFIAARFSCLIRKIHFTITFNSSVFDNSYYINL